MVGNKLYPIKFEPVLEETVWGGSTIRNYRAIDEGPDYGISWEVSAHPNATNVIANGMFKGLTLEALINQNVQVILGDKVSGKDILRVSYISAKDNLSIQVHPYTKELEQNEIWYVLDAPANAEVILGLTVDNKDDLAQQIADGKTEAVLKHVPVEVGDFIYIPGGLVHALTSGMTVLEVGQNHDNTYRLFDYNRGREIHVEESLKYTRYDVEPIFSKVSEFGDDSASQSMYSGSDFAIDYIRVKETYKSTSNHDKYYVYTNVGEDCLFEYEDEEIEFCKGESILVPAYLGNYIIKGNTKLIKSYL